jgi:hypothetical protein
MYIAAGGAGAFSAALHAQRVKSSKNVREIDGTVTAQNRRLLQFGYRIRAPALA